MSKRQDFIKEVGYTVFTWAVGMMIAVLINFALPETSTFLLAFMGMVGAMELLNQGWDLMIAHPPCTHLAVSGARWFTEKAAEQAAALEFVRALMDAPIPRIAIENPVSIISSNIRKPDQVIQPYMFGHGEMKTTCLWLKNLPKLAPTAYVAGREQRIWKLPPSEDRWKERSRTYSGIALAMAEQWGEASPVQLSMFELCG
jgi:site-specific DNA-cytosine methylase